MTETVMEGSSLLQNNTAREEGSLTCVPAFPKKVHCGVGKPSSTNNRQNWKRFFFFFTVKTAMLAKSEMSWLKSLEMMVCVTAAEGFLWCASHPCLGGITLSILNRSSGIFRKWKCRLWNLGSGNVTTYYVQCLIQCFPLFHSLKDREFSWRACQHQHARLQK